jgi:hypothetical protein
MCSVKFQSQRNSLVCAIAMYQRHPLAHFAVLELACEVIAAGCHSEQSARYTMKFVII